MPLSQQSDWSKRLRPTRYRKGENLLIDYSLHPRMAFPTNLQNTLVLLVSWRLISVYVVQTSDVPDEYWQSMEVAHRLAFGYGYLTWEWQAKIRSYIYPFLISLLYRTLALVHLDRTILLITLPRIFQAIISGYADYRFYVWTRSKWALFTICTNWFWYYYATRTLTNSLETALTTIALSIFPWTQDRSDNTAFLWIVGFLTATRPTAAILWTPLCVYHIWTSCRKISLIRSYCFIGSITLFYTIIIDSWCYGTFVVTPWNFFKINVLNGVATFYGIHHFLWYVLAALPVILGLHVFVLPFAAVEALRYPISQKRQVVMITVVSWTIAVFSMLAHKEFRFILSLLPLLIYVCTWRRNFLFTVRIADFWRKVLLGLFVTSNLLPGLYICLIHQRGSLDVMRLLEQEITASNSTSKSLMFLTPCHATPLYSHLHINVPVRILTCEPNLQNLPNYVDETDAFFKDPMLWLNENGKTDFSPTILVLFDNLSPKIMPFLRNYRLLAKIFHAHFPQSYHGEYIEVWRKK